MRKSRHWQCRVCLKSALPVSIERPSGTRYTIDSYYGEGLIDNNLTLVVGGVELTVHFQVMIAASRRRAIIALRGRGLRLLAAAAIADHTRERRGQTAEEGREGQLNYPAQGAIYYTVDVQYHSSMGVIWSILEEDFVIIMGYVPTLRGIVLLFQKNQKIASAAAP